MNQNKIQTKNSYKNNMKILNEQGVTIIALSVTILVMLILSGVVLNAALRDNGLIDKASQSTEKYEETQEKEEDRIQDFQDDLYDQFEDAGTEAPNQSNWDMSKVTPISDGKGNVIPVPKGFYYAGGNKSTGFVISDQEGDDLKNSAGGNQFVWIPCTASEYREAKDDVMDENWSHNTQYETNGTSTTGKGLAWSDDYTDADIKKVNDVYVAKSVPEATISAITSKWEKNQTSKAIESTGKYGGFYIARYEAGVPSNASFYINSDLTYNHTNRGQVNTAGLNAINGLSPVSKKGVQVWNYINQSNAKTVAENMYKDKNNDSVGSYLIDSQAWNRVCQLFKDVLGTKDTQRTILNSTKFGNYYNNTSTDYSKINGLWAKYGLTDADKWDTYASKYEKGNINVKPDSTYTKSSTTYKYRIELGTGLCDDFRVYNIYDMAGNVWEWTTGHNINGDKMYVVPRGGSFKYAGDGYPIVHAEGDDDLNTVCHAIMGFRVVLYVK